MKKLIFKKLIDAGCDLEKLDKDTLNALEKANKYLIHIAKEYQIKERLELTYDMLMEDISILELSARAENALRYGGIDKIWKLYILDNYEFENFIVNFGKKSYDEVIKRLDACFGISILNRFDRETEKERLKELENYNIIDNIFIHERTKKYKSYSFYRRYTDNNFTYLDYRIKSNMLNKHKNEEGS